MIDITAAPGSIIIPTRSPYLRAMITKLLVLLLCGMLSGRVGITYKSKNAEPQQFTQSNSRKASDDSNPNLPVMAVRRQKAVFVHEIGRPVRLVEREVPTPAEGEVLVKDSAAQRKSSLSLRTTFIDWDQLKVLPHDSYGRYRGVFIGDKLPFVLGSSLAGV